ncbi:MarR family winged helix-turn-helix transcriptional regulator [Clostridium massiliamazoniense]|uniref:MarR family winged helix-turn-helix transcriptional regulator n=1 Tax=Clostridium massiliamazoniense TaxID=1347366 RepID=UPI0006D79F98|nr:MarR family transcriptional regulator [Clostridium massiliamazoniense]
MSVDINLSLLIKIVGKNFDKCLNNRVSGLDLTSSQCKILGFLHLNDGKEVNPIDIEREFKLKKPTVTGLLKRLEEKGFISLEHSSKDKRYKQIILTEKSREHHELMKKNILEVEEIMYKGITEKDKEEMKRILQIIIKNTM